MRVTDDALLCDAARIANLNDNKTKIAIISSFLIFNILKPAKSNIEIPI